MQESWSSGNKDKGNESYKGTYCQSYLRNSGSYSCMIADEAEIKEPPILQQMCSKVYQKVVQHSLQLGFSRVIGFVSILFNNCHEDCLTQLLRSEYRVYAVEGIKCNLRLFHDSAPPFITSCLGTEKTNISENNLLQD